ncbi:hypothetical protein AB0M44_06140 [Streptosporangium subroseum]|uniref:hypothetical protein n=1 Tax=Streptosporangium subroseum TaxID=106412 RepID=UPI00341919B8
MSAPTGAGRFAPGSGQGAIWVSEHGAHLMDYAAYHLESGRAPAAVMSALTVCQVEAAPEGVTARGRLLAVLRRDCRAVPTYREQYVPGSGPGMPEALLIERVWTIVDPLGTETLRLMYRHGLVVEDLSHVLAMPVEEVNRLATRTQDLIETLVSGLDSLAHGRRTCPELAPLVEALFPDEQGATEADGAARSTAERNPQPVADSGDVRAALLSHMITCSVCTRPINIRYTVPQMISHPPVSPLAPEVRQLFLDSLRRAAASPAPPLPAPTPPPGALRKPRPRMTPYPPAAPGLSAKPAGGKPAANPSTPSNLPNLPPLPAPPRTRPIRPPSAPPVPGHDTPLYDALLTQAWAREVLAQSEEVTTMIPRQAAAPGPAVLPEQSTVPGSVVLPGQAAVEMRDDTHVPALRFHAEFDDHPGRDGVGPGERLVEALAWAGARVKSTTIKIVIIVVAGAAGTLTGMNLLGPAIETEEPASSLQASTTQETQEIQDPWTADAPADPDGIATRLRIPAVVTLDEFGQGSIVLTLSGDPLTWRISAPGLAVTPSSGTLKQGRTEVVTLRAHRIRQWCGTPASVTTPLTVHGPDDSITTTVRWRTC